MDPSEILAAVTGAGGALVALAVGCWLFVTGKVVPRSALEDKDRQLTEKDRQIAEWKAAHSAERTRADAAIVAVQTTNSVLSALHGEAARREVAP